jgi:hypothetical protein
MAATPLYADEIAAKELKERKAAVFQFRTL